MPADREFWERGMPKATVDQVNAKTEALKTKLAEKGDSMDGPDLRALKKQIRRLQRRRRSMVAAEARAAAPKAKAAAPAAEEKKEEEKAEEKKEE